MVVAALNLTLNFMLVPSLGAMGAAMAIFGSMAVKLLLESAVSYHCSPCRTSMAALRLVLIGTALYFIGTSVAWGTLWVNVSVKAALLLAAPLLLYATGFFEPSELSRLRGSLWRIRRLAGALRRRPVRAGNARALPVRARSSGRGVPSHPSDLPVPMTPGEDLMPKPVVIIPSIRTIDSCNIAAIPEDIDIIVVDDSDGSIKPTPPEDASLHLRRPARGYGARL